ncbi:MAG: carbohydrate ABC transporter permease [Cellulomonadaceae bacterium]|jgi:raffinose/stachyose/melibiose transport system permease protein|nr:carbohydrate ABC transporter permease [Cellulomonadaceae bacterium]
MDKVSKHFKIIAGIGLTLVSIFWIFPLLFILMNSFKNEAGINTSPFSLPNADTFKGIQNYSTSIQGAGFFQAIGLSFFITIVSVVVIVLFCSMCAWYIVRVKTWYTSVLYYMFIFSMIVPFQMVQKTMPATATWAGIANSVGIILLYLGFGAGLSVFMFTGFIRAIPIELEEAAMIDGASAWRVFFQVIFPVLKPTAITIAVLNAMWVWNDFLLPYIINVKTIPVVIQGAMVGAYGQVNRGGFMAMLVLAIIPIIAFYLWGQKHIIKGVTAGAVKG